MTEAKRKKELFWFIVVAFVISDIRIPNHAENVALEAIGTLAAQWAYFVEVNYGSFPPRKYHRRLERRPAANLTAS